MAVTRDEQEQYDALLRAGARRLTGHGRRLFQAEVCLALCGGNARRAERRFGWGRENVATGLGEYRSGIRCVERFDTRGRRRAEDADPRLGRDIREVVDPRTHADPELKSDRLYANLTAAEVRQALVAEKGWREQDLPGERAVRSILNRLGYRLRRVRKGKPLKKVPETDAVFANVKAAREQYRGEQARGDPGTLEISVDAKAKVAIGEYARGGKNPSRNGR